MIWLSGGEGGYACMLPEIARVRTEVLHEGLKLFAAIFVVSEHVETCEARTQQNVIAGISEFRRAAHRLAEIRTARVCHAEGRAVKCELGTCLADQDHVL